MNIKEHKKDFNRRWNITSSDSPEEAFKEFKQRIINIFENINSCFDGKGIKRFCQIMPLNESYSQTILLMLM